MTTQKDDRNEDTRRAALKELHGLRHEGAELGGAMSAMAKRQAVRAASHFAGQDGKDGATEHDPIELWGKRIGRALSLIGFVALAIYLYVTYIR